MKDTRAAINQAKINDSAANLLFAEIIAVAIVLGIMNNSWGVGGFVLLVLIACTWFRKSLIILLIALTLVWPIIVWIAATGSEANLGTKLVFTVLALVFATGVHMNAFNWTEDVSREE